MNDFSARTLSLKLAQFATISGTQGEKEFALFLKAVLLELPYFKENPDLVQLVPVPNDTLERHSVFALVKGEAAKTILLTGHFDVVSTSNMGIFEDLAFQPEKLKAKMIEQLELTGTFPKVLDDINNDFLPGRGLLDMKSGLAAGIVALNDYAQQEKREGHLLFMATPDEEVNSVGMRSAAAYLPKYLEEHKLEPELGINLDSISDQGDGSSGQVITLGTIGKLLLSALVIGNETHASYPFEGINAAYLNAAIISALECAPELTDTADLRIAPTLLGTRDLKAAYDVTTPKYVWSYWNVITEDRRATDVLNDAKKLVQNALQNIKETLEFRAEQKKHKLKPQADISVFSYAELFQELDVPAQARFTEFAETVAQENADLPSQNASLTVWLWEELGKTGPAIILGFSGLPYPANSFGDSKLEQDLKSLIQAAATETALRHETPITLQAQFPGISDMSFLGRVDKSDLAFTALNTAAWKSAVHWDVSQDSPDIPMINAGPWGRDYHQRFERLHEHYAFYVLPDLIKTIIANILKPDVKKG